MKILLSILSFENIRKILKLRLKHKLAIVLLPFIFMFILASLEKMHHKALSSSKIDLIKSLNQQEPEFIFLGSSRFYTGIHLDFLPKPSYIISIPYASAEIILKILETHIDRIKLAKTVFIELSPEMFCIDPLEVHPHQIQSLNDLGVTLSFWERLEKSFQQGNIDYFVPNLSRLRFNPSEIIQTIKNNKNRANKEDLRKFGFIAMEKSLTEQTKNESVSDHIQRIEKYCEKKNFTKNMKSYKKIIRILDTLNVKYSLVEMPTIKSYEQLRKPLIRSFSSVLAEFKEAKKNSIIDMNSKISLSLSEFADVNHLNTIGAQKVSSTLLKSLDNN